MHQGQPQGCTNVTETATWPKLDHQMGQPQLDPKLRLHLIPVIKVMEDLGLGNQPTGQGFNKKSPHFIPEEAAILIVHKAFPPSVSRPQRETASQSHQSHTASDLPTPQPLVALRGHGSPAIKCSFRGAWET